ncbi:hypothetical protein BaRGS_00018816 [Batillaria attramentaria]|uniref:GOLD domain-containing protein n=1 Tax=Batillaria attramentaria TaxID=370345 RepID=A0ABD0KSD9_9CAEN
MEAASADIHGTLARISSYQVYFRHREAAGRAFAESLTNHVLLWSIGETVAVLVVGLGQVMVLRSFFSGPRLSTKSNSVAT